jgi:hypothetical protein
MSITVCKIQITQIAILPESESRGSELYGVGTDGIVYYFSIHQQSWIPLPNAIGIAPPRGASEDR